jgi:hypothetical protein
LFCHPRGLGTRPRDVDSLLGGASEANLVTQSRPSSPLMTGQKSSIPRTKPQLHVINHFCTTQHMLLPYTSLCHSLHDNYIFKQPLTCNATHFEMVTNTSISILQNTFEHLRTEPQLSIFNHLRTALYSLKFKTSLSILKNTFEPVVVRILHTSLYILKCCTSKEYNRTFTTTSFRNLLKPFRRLLD